MQSVNEPSDTYNRLAGKGLIPVPQWLCNQLMRAFYNKNRRQVRLLNDCWFFYRTRRSDTEDSSSLLQ
ncbi:cortex morphogenetic protein CmpA [Paenibacillus xerothermodurans]|uniref:Cortex morphogenetic protein CmpA n=1 Tax=Paenibacillus xerothermodurans TaxID=1977292 RepID=A0A2W1NA56_PAEXE|nr:cortex morphogenetic protein CmpA [Paenibacillus xerothermodurans]